MRFYGNIGFSETRETSPGVWTETLTQRAYYGDITRASNKWDKNGDKLNDDLNISNTVSIVADAFALDNLGNMRYAQWSGTKWKITNVEVQYPRLVLSLGGIYNE